MSKDLSRPSDRPDLSDVCGTISRTLVQQARDRIDNEIMLLLRSVPPLCSQRNALSHACRLPPELLSMIFLHYARDWYTDPGSKFVGQVAPWVAVSYVCRTWRDVALNCGVIWGHLFFVSLDWTLELLERSKAAPLLVRMHLTSVDSYVATSSLRMVLRHMERVEDMHVLNLLTPNSEIENMLDVEAPSLRSLQISSEDLAVNLFRGETPALRKLVLHRCYTHWSSPIFNGLTHLSLTYNSCVRTVASRDLLGILRRSPCLREFHFEDVFPDRVEISARAATGAVVKVALLHLERFTLIGDVSAVAPLLACLEMPLFTAVRLTFVRHAVIQCTGAFQSFVPNRFNGGLTLSHSHKSPSPLLGSLRTSCRDSQGRRTSCVSSNLDTDLPYSSQVEEQGSSIRTLLELYSEGWEAVVAICGVLPLIHLTKVALHGDRIPRMDGGFWVELFGLAPRLCEIELDRSYRGASSLISALRTDVLFAPALVNMTIKRTLFVGSLHGTNQDIYPNPPCIWCLRDALATRAKSGTLLQSLSISCDYGDSLTQDHVVRLQQVVGDLDLITAN
ncbi:hypothetical protein EDD16DRAFT_1706202 [Pisolithus croceorrhizus]|nr:hypothetical protein EDD16DRAFT_1706202 [Pisolithus croceorrhizus]KAI6123292.1 hypothetical protein EV401DRAFT_2208292 [Pisolithus croceorrhizus]KAI6167976.1 hypothetical protein EDD17DRAFT_1828674 [Pisolithus thermaeus]